MYDIVDKILALIGSFDPLEVPSEADWNEFELRVGRSLPADYKCLIGAIGTGCFGISFWLRNPRARGTLSLSEAQLLVFRQGNAPLEWLDVLSFPDKNGLINIGECATRTWLFLKPVSISDWQLVYGDAEMGVVSEMDMGVPEFVLRLWENQIDRAIVANLRESIWDDGNTSFFSPARSSDIHPQQGNVEINCEISGTESIADLVEKIRLWKPDRDV